MTGVVAVEIADLTGDRANDLVVGNGTVTLLAGNGRGGFAKPKVLVPAQVDRFDVGDLDGDGRLDLVVGTAGGPLRALRQTTTGSFAALWSRTAPTDSGRLRGGDVTGDGKADVVVGGDDLAVLNGATGAPVQQVAGVYSRLDALATGDVDGDGDQDTLAWQSSGSGLGVGDVGRSGHRAAAGAGRGRPVRRGRSGADRRRGPRVRRAPGDRREQRGRPRGPAGADLRPPRAVASSSDRRRPGGRGGVA